METISVTPARGLSARVPDDSAENGPVTSRLIRDFDELASISVAWDQMVARSDFDDVFATYGFARAWWRAYGSSKNLHVAVLEDGDSRPKLIAPLYSENSSSRTLRVVGDPRGDYNNLIFEKADQRSLGIFFSWLRARNGWRSLRLAKLPAESAIHSHFPFTYGANDRRMRKLRCWMRIGSLLVCSHPPTLHPRINNSKLDEIKDLLSGWNYRKHVYWFGRQGKLEYRRLSSVSDCLSVLPEFMDLHIAEFAAKGMKSLFVEEDNRRFYRFMLEELDRYSAVRLDCLTLDGKLIAGHFGFDWDGRLYYYKPCFEPKYSSHSPGKVLFGHIVKDAVERGLCEIDFLTPGGDYKTKYASDFRAKSSLMVYRSPFAALLDRRNFR